MHWRRSAHCADNRGHLIDQHPQQPVQQDCQHCTGEGHIHAAAGAVSIQSAAKTLTHCHEGKIDSSGWCLGVKSVKARGRWTGQWTVLVKSNRNSSECLHRRTDRHECCGQVDCTPPDGIVIRILAFRTSAGGYVKLTHLQSGGIATVKSIDFKSSTAPVS